MFLENWLVYSAIPYWIYVSRELAGLLGNTVLDLCFSRTGWLTRQYRIGSMFLESWLSNSAIPYWIYVSRELAGLLDNTVMDLSNSRIG
ncbi:hypothetical protein RRG08_052522 [Elysia crispata]|uniref:Uncharacterized protein n=1 Tax=Elysia crispata TaxID=231223 RepID=A0AAE1CTM2_9GAST|nr:hypothetical protein RRG08_052522 [Elysia crispata]